MSSGRRTGDDRRSLEALRQRGVAPLHLVHLSGEAELPIEEKGIETSAVEDESQGVRRRQRHGGFGLFFEVDKAPAAIAGDEHVARMWSAMAQAEVMCFA